MGIPGIISKQRKNTAANIQIRKSRRYLIKVNEEFLSSLKKMKSKFKGTMVHKPTWIREFASIFSDIKLYLGKHVAHQQKINTQKPHSQAPKITKIVNFQHLTVEVNYNYYSNLLNLIKCIFEIYEVKTLCFIDKYGLHEYVIKEKI